MLHGKLYFFVLWHLNVYMYLLSVMEPGVIRRQMLMQQFTMLKFFLSALATSKHHLKIAF